LRSPGKKNLRETMDELITAAERIVNGYVGITAP
jgi:hypothetical protein